MRQKLIFPLLAAVLCITRGNAQDTLTIAKVQVLENAAKGNLANKIAQLEFRAAQADYRQSNSVFLPALSASYTALSTTNPLMAFGSKLNQEVLTASDFNPALLNDPARTQNYATRIELLQPLVNLDGVMARRAARAKMDAYRLSAERNAEYIQLETLKAYLQLQLAYKAVATLKKAAATASASLTLINNYYSQGQLQKTDVLAAQVRENEIRNQMRAAMSNVANASGYLALLMGRDDPAGVVYKPAEEPANTITAQEYGSGTLLSRKDIAAMKKSEEAYRNMWKSSALGLVPRLNAFATYEMFDNQIFRATANGYTVGLQMSWNVFDGYKTAGKSQKAKAEMDKAGAEAKQYTAKSILELEKTKRMLADAGNKVAVSELSLQQSEEAYRIRKNRFAQGLEKTTDLLAVESLVLQKEMELLQAVFEYNFSQQYLQFLTR